VEVPLAPGREEVKIWSEDACRRAGDNLAFAIPHVEEALIASVEPERPPGAAWYSRVAS
jgi:hypothetical protein